MTMLKPLEYLSYADPYYVKVALALCLIPTILRIREATSFLFPSSEGDPNAVIASRAALAAGTGAAIAPHIDSDFFTNTTVGSALSQIASGSASVVYSLWNLIPTNGKLLIAAGAIYWGWQKWKQQTLDGVRVENSNNTHFEVHFNGIGAGSKVEQTTIEESDGTKKIVYQLSVPQEPKRKSAEESNFIVLTKDQFWGMAESFLKKSL